MKSPKIFLFATVALIAATAPAAFAQSSALTTEVAISEGQKLKALFAADDEAQLKRNPLGAIFLGDMRYSDRLGYFIRDEYFAK